MLSQCRSYFKLDRAILYRHDDEVELERASQEDASLPIRTKDAEAAVGLPSPSGSEQIGVDRSR